jgi:hypothetical protein
MSLLGDNLIFLISQPRAGSTLLQRILAGHPEIHTVSEPWLMLHPLFPLSNGDGCRAEYDAEMAGKAFKEFLSHLIGGEAEYLAGVRSMYGRFYAKALEQSGKRFFLDKTPRYYFIIRELRATFPEAHFLIMLRNPLAVLCSVVRTWVKGKWHRAGRYKHDLIKAPRLLLDGLRAPGGNVLAVSYEELVKDPAGQVAKVCAWLGVDFVSDILDYAERDIPRWTLGDQQNIYRFSRPSSGSLDNWLLGLHEPQTWRLATDYLEFLGRDNLREMGYDYEALKETLQARRPSKARLWFTSPMARLLGDEPK